MTSGDSDRYWDPKTRRRDANGPTPAGAVLWILLGLAACTPPDTAPLVPGGQIASDADAPNFAPADAEVASDDPAVAASGAGDPPRPLPPPLRETRLVEDGSFPDAGANDEVRWAEGFEGLIRGLDGYLYEGYGTPAISRTQQTLRTRGLYNGPIDGVLDLETMRAIYAFQEASYGLSHSGIPTPRTRHLLDQGSHTP
jgi:hypothetical protein